MIKKVFFFLILFLSSLVVLFSQSDENSKSLQQYQTFSLKAVANVRKYEVAVEKQADDGSWVALESKQTSETTLEMLLYPGDYRVSISAFNVLGRKATSTDWVSFIILDETEPFLFASMFDEDEDFNCAALYLNVDDDSLQASSGDVSEEITMPSQEHLEIHGKNIFFEETNFSFVPSNSTDENGLKSYIERRDVPLSIVKRDRDNDIVEVSFDRNMIFTGYYDLLVKNPGNESSRLPVLIFDSKKSQIDSKEFEFNKRYQVPSFAINKTEKKVFEVKVSNINSLTKYKLIPQKSDKPYPFESVKRRQEVSLEPEKCVCVDNTTGLMDLSFNLSGSEFETGYYSLVLETPGQEAGEEMFLFDVTTPPETRPKVEKIKTKEKKGAVSITLSGENLAMSNGAVLVAPYSDATGENKRIPLKLETSKKTGEQTLLLASSMILEPGEYALYLEGDSGTTIQYITVEKDFEMSKNDLSEAEKNKIFFRPEQVEVVAQKAKEVKEFSGNDFESSFFITFNENDWKIERIESLLTAEELSSQPLLNFSVSKDNVLEVKDLKLSEKATQRGKNRVVTRSQDIIDLLQMGNNFKIITDKASSRFWSIELIVNKDEKEFVVDYPLTRNRKSVNGKYVYSLQYKDFKCEDESVSNSFEPENVVGLGFRTRDVADFKLVKDELIDTSFPMQIFSIEFPNPRTADSLAISNWGYEKLTEDLTEDELAAQEPLSVQLSKKGVLMFGNQVKNNNGLVQGGKRSIVNRSPIMTTILQSGDTLKLVTDKINARIWAVELIIEKDGKEYLMDFPLSKNRKSVDGKYVYTIPYRSFKELKNRKEADVFSVSDIKGIAFRTREIAAASVGKNERILDDFRILIYSIDSVNSMQIEEEE